MKIILFFIGLAALTTATEFSKPVKTVADTTFLEKQKTVLELLWGVTQPVTCQKVIEVANAFRIEENIENYTNTEAVKKFVTLYKYGTLPKEELFSVFNEKQLKEAIALFDLFYYAKDFETFYKTACFARVHFNPGQFVYAFITAVVHREDFEGIVLPTPYEIIPHFFVDGEVVQKAYNAKFFGGEEKSGEPVVITINDTRFYPYYQYNFEKRFPESKTRGHFFDYDVTADPEDRVSYFTEDVALNTYNYYFHVYNPFFLNSSYGYKPEGRGELFFYYHQQILARYFLERLSNDLPDIETVGFGIPIRHGYNPNLRYPNGKAFPARPDNVVLNEYTTFESQLVDDFARRISDAIDFGYVFTSTGEKVSIFEPNGIDKLGQLIESTANSVHPKFYGKLYYYGMKVFGHIVDPQYSLDVAPGVLEHYQTALRDPLFYRLVGLLTQFYYRYKSHLDTYKYEDLAFPGVKVSALEVGKLVTFFENFEFEISSAVTTKHILEDAVVKARQYRLNHKPFTFKINVESDKATNAMIRVFIGPKYDVEGHFIDLESRRKFMVEIDRFPYQVAVGENVVVRNSADIFSTVRDAVSVSELLKSVEEGLNGKTPFEFEKLDRQCGFPNRFLLPKGKRGGLPLTFFVAVTPLTGDLSAFSFDSKYQSTVGCGTGLGLFPQDGRPMGFPFDRPVDEAQFFVPNFFEKDVLVFHKRTDEVANESI